MSTLVAPLFETCIPRNRKDASDAAKIVLHLLLATPVSAEVLQLPPKLAPHGHTKLQLSFSYHVLCVFRPSWSIGTRICVKAPVLSKPTTSNGAKKLQKKTVNHSGKSNSNRCECLSAEQRKTQESSKVIELTARAWSLSLWSSASAILER